ncbi:tenascin-X-like [Alosa pseudoharengus]|uniref:tenascin-X-like n=1 Tax=Alosa pseudoharengus TaxID=34774 RepID=UPI003F89306C
MTEMAGAAEYQDDITAVKERIYSEDDHTSMQGNLHRESGCGETAVKKSLPTGIDSKTLSCFQEKEPCPVPSVVSMKSERSVNRPVHLAGDFTETRVHLEKSDSSDSDSPDSQLDDSVIPEDSLRFHDGRRQSPVPSVMSMKSDQSMILPVSFAGDRTSGERGNLLCSVCPGRAFKSCLTCMASFCETHVRQHYTAPALQRHKLVEATGDLEQRLCQQHYRELELFCKTDKTSVCAICVAREHSGHEITEQGENESLQLHKSQGASQIAHPSPGPIEFPSIKPDSVSLTWGAPEGLIGPQKYRVTWNCEGDQENVEVFDIGFTAEELIPGKKYEFTVATLMDDGSQSLCVFGTANTEIPKPDNVTFTSDLTSLSVTWCKPAGVDDVKYLLSLHSDGKCLKTLTLKSLQRRFDELQIGKEYSISVFTVLKKGGQSDPVTKNIRTRVPVPEQLSVDSVTATTAHLSWSLSHIMDQTPHSFLISYHSESTETQTISADSCSTVITDLKPNTDYIVNVCTKTQHGGQSQPSEMTFRTAVSVPNQLTVVSVTPTSVHLTWPPPHGMEKTPHSYQISYHSGGSEPQIISRESCSADITGLKPYINYSLSVCTVCTKLKDGEMSEPAKKEVRTAVPAPEQLKVASVTPTSANLTWTPPHGMDQTPESYQISYHDGRSESKPFSRHSCSTIIESLEPCSDYVVSVCAKLMDGAMSEPAKQMIHTAVSVPEQLKVASVTPTSVHLTWSPPHGMEKTPHSYQISYQSGGSEPQIISRESCSADITGLKPYINYSLSVCTVCTKLKDGEMSEPAKKEVRTAVPAPEQLKVASVTPTSANLTWTPPHGMDQTPESYQISYHDGRSESKPFSRHSCSTIIESLEPCSDYVVSVCAKLMDGAMSEPAKQMIHTAVSVPEQLKVASVTPTSVHLTWSPPHGMEKTPHSYQISYQSGGSEPQIISRESCSADITGLKPYINYSLSVCTVCTKLKDGEMSEPAKKEVRTAVPAPEQLKVASVTPTSANLTWTPPHGMDQTPESYQISYHDGRSESKPFSRHSCSTIIESLEPCSDYVVSVCAKLMDGAMSEPAKQMIHTAVSVPEQLKVASVTPTSVHLTWSPPHGMEKTPHSYQISYQSGGSEPQIISRESCSADITGLKPYINYSLSVCTVCTKLKDGEMSEPAKKEVRTAVPAPEQLKVASVTPTSANLTWTPPHGMDQTPESYQISYHDGRSESKPFSRHSCSTIIESLEPCSDYVVSVCAKLMDGAMSEPAKQMIHTAVSVPEQLKVASVTPTSVHLTWSPPHGMEKTPHSYQISYQSGGSEPQIISRESCSADITGLKPYINYSLSVCTVCTKLKDGEMSEPAKKEVRTAVPAPEQLKVASVTPTSANLTWTPPHGMDQTPESYQISYHDGRSESKPFSRHSCSTIIESLEPCSDYVVSVCAKLMDGAMSEPAKQMIHTAVSVPEQLKVASVTPTSVHLTWSPPHGMEKTPHSYQISYQSGGSEPQIISRESCSADITGLKPYINYSLSVCTVCTKLKDGEMSEPAKKEVRTAVPAPEQLKVASVTPTSANLTWTPPHGMDQTPESYQISYHDGRSESKPFSRHSCSTIIESLEPCSDYVVSVCAKLMDGAMSEPAKQMIHTAVSVPEQLKVASVTPTSVHLTWSPPHGMEKTPHSYQISYQSGGSEPQIISRESCSADITGLKPYINYSLSVCTVCTKLKDGEMSEPAKKEVRTAVPAPEQLKVASVTPTSANLTWTPPHGMDQTPESYQISYHDGRSESKPFSRHSCSTIIESLEPCSDYVVSVCAKLMDGAMSEPAKQMIHTAVSVPEQLKVASVTPTSVHLTWSPPHGMEKTPHSYQISYQSGGSEPQIISRESCSADITGLKPYINYSLSVCTVCTKLKDGEMSEPAKKEVRTAVPAPEQLKVASVTPTSANLTWTPPHGMDQTPESYQISYHDGRSESKPFSRHSCSTIIESLEPCSDYVVSVCAKLMDGAMSEPAKQMIHTAVSVPEQLKVASVTPTSVHLTWSPPHGMEKTPHSYQISYRSGGSEPQIISRESCSADITGLKPYINYSLSVCTVCTKLKDGEMSEPAKKEVRTAVPAPEQLKVASVTPTSANLTWTPPHGMDQTPESYQISYHDGRSESKPFSRHSCSTIIESLEPCSDYVVSVCAKLMDGAMSEPAKQMIHTAVSVPEQLKVASVTPTSVHLTWSPPHGMEKTPHSYQISYQSGGSEPQIISRESCSADITGLKPYINYSLSVCTVCTKLKDGEMSEPAKKEVRTAVPAPEQLKVASVTPTSANLTWTPPHGMDQTPESYQISYHDGRSESKPFSRHSCSTIIESLEPCSDYVVSVCAKLMDGAMSEPAKQMIHTAVSVPEQLKVASVTPTSVHLTWSPPHGMEKTPHSYQISYQSGGSEPQIISRESCSADITGLKPYINYSLSVCTVCTKLKDGEMSEPAKKEVRTAVPAPEQLKVASVTPTSANLTWTPPHGMDQTPESYQISYHDGRSESKPFSRHSCSTIIESLEPCSDYVVSVCAKLMDGAMSEPAKQMIHTAVSVPEQLKVASVTPTSVHLTWSPPHGMEKTPHSYQISYQSGGSEPQIISRESCSADITGLKPYINYSLSVCTVCTKLKDGEMSEPAKKEVRTAVPAPEQLKVASVTPTSANLTWTPPHGMDDLLPRRKV